MTTLAAAPGAGFSASQHVEPVAERAAGALVAEPYRIVCTGHGTMLVNCNDIYMGQSYLKYGECCELEVGLLLRMITLPGMVIEVGANMGVHTIPMARATSAQGRSMLVFEPQPIIFQQLCANLALNSVMSVTALPLACGSEEGVLSFAAPDYLSPGNFGGTEFSAHSAECSALIRVRCRKLDDTITELATRQPVALLKIDVEGHELGVLQGAESILVQFHPILYVENDRLQNSRQLIAWLLDRGYRLWWHITHLFNPENYFRDSENIYPGLACFNMLAVHPIHNLRIGGLDEITGPDQHPLRRSEKGPFAPDT